MCTSQFLVPLEQRLGIGLVSQARNSCRSDSGPTQTLVGFTDCFCLSVHSVEAGSSTPKFLAKPLCSKYALFPHHIGVNLLHSSSWSRTGKAEQAVPCIPGSRTQARHLVLFMLSVLLLLVRRQIRGRWELSNLDVPSRRGEWGRREQGRAKG